MIPERAVELGRLIGQTEEYKALKRAEGRLTEAAELRSKLEQLRRMAEALERQAAEGTPPSEAEANAYDQLLNAIQVDQVYQGVVAAQANFDKLMALRTGIS